MADGDRLADLHLYLYDQSGGLVDVHDARDYGIGRWVPAVFGVITIRIVNVGAEHIEYELRLAGGYVRSAPMRIPGTPQGPPLR